MSHHARGLGSGRKAYSTTTSKQDSPHPASHRARGRGRRRTTQASLILRVDGTHQKYSSVQSLSSKVGPTWFAFFNITCQVTICLFTRGRRSSLHLVDNQHMCQITTSAAFSYRNELHRVPTRVWLGKRREYVWLGG